MEIDLQTVKTGGSISEPFYLQSESKEWIKKHPPTLFGPHEFKMEKGHKNVVEITFSVNEMGTNTGGRGLLKDRGAESKCHGCLSLFFSSSHFSSAAQPSVSMSLSSCPSQRLAPLGLGPGPPPGLSLPGHFEEEEWDLDVKPIPRGSITILLSTLSRD